MRSRNHGSLLASIAPSGVNQRTPLFSSGLDGQRVAVVRDEKIGHIQVQMRGNVCAPLLMSVHGQDLE